MPPADRSLAAPNGCPKLIILYDNSLESTVNGRVQVSPPGLYFVGNRDTSASIQTSSRETGFIGIEFCPFGAYPFLGIPMNDVVNHLFGADELLSQWGRQVQEALCNLERVDQKVDFIQEQLVRLLQKSRRHSALIEFCVTTLKLADGRLPIRELERNTGYTWRYLDLLFKRHVGFSPKVLAGIFRFQRFYRQWARGLSFDEMKEDLYEYYYDQAHFTREFKKITGYPPRKFAYQVSNEFGRRLSLK